MFCNNCNNGVWIIILIILLFGWTRIPFMKDGLERDVDEKNEEIYSILRSAL